MELKERNLAGLEAKLDQLEQVKERQAGQIESLRQSRHHMDEKSGEATNTIRHLTDELNKVKYTLDDVTKRHGQVRFITFTLTFHTVLFSLTKTRVKRNGNNFCRRFWFDDFGLAGLQHAAKSRLTIHAGTCF